MSQFRRIFNLSAIAMATLVGFGSGAALAAPQVLALVETKGKVVLTCGEVECSAELTSFCLDAGRFSPHQGTPYRLAADGPVHLTVTTRDGRVLPIDVMTKARFVSVRRHFAVRVSVGRDVLEELGAHHAEVEVAANATLLPVPVPGDLRPIGKQEAALFSGPLRKVGSTVVDANKQRMAAARITSRMINLLGANRARSTPDTEVLWRRATAAHGGFSQAPKAIKMARGAVELCRYVARVDWSKSLRGCLEERHDGMVDFLNSKYWKAVKTGF